MTRHRRREVADALRQRLLRALQIGAAKQGDRLPGTRDLARDLAADPRVIADALRDLAAEGLVELRARSGVYYAANTPRRGARQEPGAAWLAEVLVDGIARGIPAPDLPALLRRSLGTGRLPVVAVATTLDQTMGICRELETFGGLDASGVLADAITPVPHGATVAVWRGTLPRAFRRARLVVTTEAHAKRVAAAAARLGKRSVTVTVRPELYDTEWALLHGLDAYVVVADPRFGALVDEYLRGIGAEARVHVRVAGRDAVDDIPREAPTYVTQAARERLGRLRLPGGVLPPARVLSDACLRDVLREVIEMVRRDASTA